MTPRRFLQTLAILSILFFALTAAFPVHAEAGADIPGLNNFVTNVRNGWSGVLRGVYVEGKLALRIVQQPAENPGYVSSADEVVTQFGMARNYGNIGLLAHNTHAGKYFSSLQVGDRIKLVYGNGKVEAFVVQKVLRYRAVNPTSPYTNFIDLETGDEFTVTEVFNQVYAGDYHVTLQTCIEQDGDLSWGRLFIIAAPAPVAGHTVEAEFSDR